MARQKKRVNRVVAGELRGFVERYERLTAEIGELQDHRTAVMAEAKAQGYDPKIMRLIIRERARDADELAEERAIADVYREALGLAGTPLDAWSKGGGSDFDADFHAGADPAEIRPVPAGKRSRKGKSEADLAKAQGLSELDERTAAAIEEARAINAASAAEPRPT